MVLSKDALLKIALLSRGTLRYSNFPDQEEAPIQELKKDYIWKTSQSHTLLNLW